MDLIDREKLKSTIRAMVEIPNEVRVKVLGAISRVKAADAVPVVRCGGCAHSANSMSVPCAYVCNREGNPCYKRITTADFGCLYGERRGP